MKAAHGGLAITISEWESCLRHTADALDDLKVLAKEKEEFLGLFECYRDDIVEA